MQTSDIVLGLSLGTFATIHAISNKIKEPEHKEYWTEMFREHTWMRWVFGSALAFYGGYIVSPADAI
jgi:hypothetical protein